MGEPSRSMYIIVCVYDTHVCVYVCVCSGTSAWQWVSCILSCILCVCVCVCVCVACMCVCAFIAGPGRDKG